MKAGGWTLSASVGCRLAMTLHTMGAMKNSSSRPGHDGEADPADPRWDTGSAAAGARSRSGVWVSAANSVVAGAAEVKRRAGSRTSSSVSMTMDVLSRRRRTWSSTSSRLQTTMMKNRTTDRAEA